MFARRIHVNLGMIDGICVRRYRAFSSMSRKQKAFALSFVLTPIFLTAALVTLRDALVDDIWWRAVVAGVWIISLIDALMYLRGPFAERQGILPKPPGQRTDLEVQRSLLFASFIVTCLNLLAIGVSKRTGPRDWRLLFMFAAVFFGQLSGYTQNLAEKREAARTDAAPEVQSPRVEHKIAS